MNTILKNSIQKLKNQELLSHEEFLSLLSANSPDLREELATHATDIKKQYFGNQIYIRGLIEFSNYCKNNCYYCGIRNQNHHLSRYRLTKEDILACCKEGYKLGFRTFVLQSGEDPHFRDEQIIDILSTIRSNYKDCAITLSIGEKNIESYKAFFKAGANRYLLRHETANPLHYEKLHPASMSYQNRIQCLNNLKAIGYQVGCGFMVGSPFQTLNFLAQEFLFIQSQKPEMIGIGPFLSHQHTPFAAFKNGTLEDTLLCISILRLIHPSALIPATTALNTVAPNGRTLGILAGANVIMPNLSPSHVRGKYQLYDHKLSANEESAQSISQLKNQMTKIGYQIVVDRGDPPQL